MCAWIRDPRRGQKLIASVASACRSPISHMSTALRSPIDQSILPNSDTTDPAGKREKIVGRDSVQHRSSVDVLCIHSTGDISHYGCMNVGMKTTTWPTKNITDRQASLASVLRPARSIDRKRRCDPGLRSFNAAQLSPIPFPVLSISSQPRSSSTEPCSHFSNVAYLENRDARKR